MILSIVSWLIPIVIILFIGTVYRLNRIAASKPLHSTTMTRQEEKWVYFGFGLVVIEVINFIIVLIDFYLRA